MAGLENRETAPLRRQSYIDPVYQYRTHDGRRNVRYFGPYGQYFTKYSPNNRNNDALRKVAISLGIFALVVLCLIILIGVVVAVAVIGRVNSESPSKSPPILECTYECTFGEPNSECNACVCGSGVLTGRITDGRMRPLADAEISDGNTADQVLALTDSSGHFRVSGICPAVQTMIIRKENYVTLAADTTIQDSTSSLLDAVLEREEHPFFVEHPFNKWRVIGEEVKFCCKAEGNPTPLYTWLKNGIPIPSENGETLLLTSLTFEDTGKYQCRAINAVGSIKSHAAELIVSGGLNGCDRDPMEKLIQLPSTCMQADTNSATYNVGTCQPHQCFLREEQTKCQDRYCCQPDVRSIVQLQCQGYIMSVTKVNSCKCASCTEDSITVNGHIELPSGERVEGINIYVNDFIISSSGNNGKFSFSFPSQAARLPLTFKDDRRQRQIVDTTKVFDISPGLNTYEVVTVSPVPVPVVIQSPSDSFVNIGTFAKVDIPSNSFYNEEGQLHFGEVLAYISVIDMRKVDDLRLLQGDFSATNRQGDFISLRSYGMFSLAFTDLTGNSLSVANRLLISVIPENVPSLTDIDQNVHLWSFNTRTGQWLVESVLVSKLSERRRRRRRQESPFEASFFLVNDWDWFNIGEHERGDACWAKVVTQTNENLVPGDILPGAKITAITGNGQPPFYHIYENVVSNLGVCLPVGCQTTSDADESSYTVYFTATIGPGMLLPADTSQLGLKLTNSDLNNLEYNTNDGAVDFSIRINPQFSNISPEGPLFNSKSLCEASTAKSFQFYAGLMTAEWSSWSPWSSCDVTCGTGYQMRMRQCLTGNLCDISANSEQRTCDSGDCPTWESWDAWGTCSVTCSDGEQIRTRQCSVRDQCDGHDSERQICSLEDCVVDIIWGQWGDCSVTCGVGEQIRSRQCGDAECDGQAQDVRECMQTECLAATWGSWTLWSDCSVTCDKGQRFRERSCSEEGLCDGNEFDERACNEQECVTASWSEWSAWGDCSVSCGYGQQTRTRECNIFLDATCEGSSSTDTQNCFIQSCETIPATWSSWGEWGECSILCGPGEQIRSRECLDPDSTGVPCDGQATTLQHCNLGACGWSSWTEWGSCDVTCGSGERSRMRVCSTRAGSPVSNSMCAGQASDVETCSDWICPDCTVVCDTGELNSNCDACVCDTSTLSGKVTDTTKRPLSDVTIAYAERPYVPLTVTDSTGLFNIVGVCATPTMIVTTKSRYGAVVSESAVVDATTSSLEVEMERMELPFIEEHPRDKIRDVGDSVAFCCIATSIPEPNKYEWFKDGDILEFAEASAATLILTDLVIGDTGSYRCRVSNKAGSVYSNPASLLVSGTPPGCDPQPRSHFVEVPLECMQPANMVDVGTCSRAQCGGDKTDQTQCMDTEEYCCIVSNSELTTINCEDYDIQLVIISSCDCLPCSIDPSRISGIASSPNNVPLFFGSIYVKNIEVAKTDESGRFNFQITAQTNRVAITFRDNSNILVETTKVVNVGRGSNIFFTVKMKERPVPMELTSTVENVIPLAGEEFEPVAQLILPANSVYDSNGDLYTGQVMFSLINIDLRRASDLQFVEGDFTAVNEDGELEVLESYGMFRFSVTDPSSNPLTIGGSVAVNVDPSQVPMGDVGPDGISDVKLWVLNKKTGSWEEESSLVGTVAGSGGRRRRQSGDISYDFFAGTFDITNEDVHNIDVILYDFRGTGNEEGCVAKVIPYHSAHEPPAPTKFLATEVLGDILFTIVGQDTEFQSTSDPFFRYYYGWSLTYYYGELVGEVGECVTVACDSNTVGGYRYENYISANGGLDFQGSYMLPARSDCTGVSSTCTEQTSLTVPELNSVNFGISAGPTNEAISISPGVPPSVSNGNQGPIYRWDDQDFCRQANETSNHFQFYFDTSDILVINTVPTSLYPQILPCSFYPSWVINPCMIRIEIESTSHDDLRVLVASSATDTDLFPGASPCNTFQFGIRQVIAHRDSSGKIEACVEFKCSGGNVENGTAPALPPFRIINPNDILGTDITELTIQIRDLDGTALNCMVCSDLQNSIPFSVPSCADPKSMWLSTPVTFTVPNISGGDAGLYRSFYFGKPPNVNVHDIMNCKDSGGSNSAIRITCP